MKIGITILGSGSKGNAILIHSENNGLLIDAGFSRKEILKRCLDADFDSKQIKALLISHEHGDHIKGARVLADHLDIPTYLTNKVYSYLKNKKLIGQKIYLFQPGDKFKVEEFEIQPFQVLHDATDPVGFIITVNSQKIGIVTDLGCIDNLVKAKLMKCEVLILECNHDKQMLMNSDRSINLKRRINGKFGHLNNVDAINSLNDIICENTKHIVFYHLSNDCNDREMVYNMAQEKISSLNRSDINFTIAKQNEILPTFWL
jgi:phosphoribosyl 1,2-cyclic phosphodiesterase